MRFCCCGHAKIDMRTTPESDCFGASWRSLHCGSQETGSEVQSEAHRRRLKAIKEKPRLAIGHRKRLTMAMLFRLATNIPFQSSGGAFSRKPCIRVWYKLNR